MDTIIMGRGMAGEFTSYWENVVDNQPEGPGYSYAKIFVGTGKPLFQNRKAFVLIDSINCSNGVLVNQYEPVRQEA